MKRGGERNSPLAKAADVFGAGGDRRGSLHDGGERNQPPVKITADSGAGGASFRHPSKVLKSLKAKHPFRFRSGLSQHFLIEPGILDRMTKAVGAKAGDLVLEVGAGAGFLTERLLATGAKVVAVEVDPGMVKLLKSHIGFNPRLKIIEGDILELDLARILDAEGVQSCLVAGNLPYHITSPALFHLLGVEGDQAWRGRASAMVFTVQREVGVRMAAGPGTRDYGSLSVAVAYAAKCEILFGVSPQCFVPQPDVESVVVRLKPVPPRLDAEHERLFLKMVRAAFGQRRKTLLNAISVAAGDKAAATVLLARAGIDGSRRGETLGLEEFLRLTQAGNA